MRDLIDYTEASAPLAEFSDPNLARAYAATVDRGYVSAGIDELYAVRQMPEHGARVIDLRRTYDIRPRQLPNGQWEVVDYETYDDDPEGDFHLAGRGESIAEAITDLLERIAFAVAHPSYRSEVVSYSPFEPPTTQRVRIPDPDVDD